MVVPTEYTWSSGFTSELGVRLDLIHNTEEPPTLLWVRASDIAHILDEGMQRVVRLRSGDVFVVQDELTDITHMMGFGPEE